MFCYVLFCFVLFCFVLFFLQASEQAAWAAVFDGAEPEQAVPLGWAGGGSLTAERAALLTGGLTTYNGNLCFKSLRLLQLGVNVTVITVLKYVILYP